MQDRNKLQEQIKYLKVPTTDALKRILGEARTRQLTKELDRISASRTSNEAALITSVCNKAFPDLKDPKRSAVLYWAQIYFNLNKLIAADKLNFAQQDELFPTFEEDLSKLPYFENDEEFYDLEALKSLCEDGYALREIQAPNAKAKQSGPAVLPKPEIKEHKSVKPAIHQAVAPTASLASKPKAAVHAEPRTESKNQIKPQTLQDVRDAILRYLPDKITRLQDEYQARLARARKTLNQIAIAEATFSDSSKLGSTTECHTKIKNCTSIITAFKNLTQLITDPQINFSLTDAQRILDPLQNLIKPDEYEVLNAGIHALANLHHQYNINMQDSSIALAQCLQLFEETDRVEGLAKLAKYQAPVVEVGPAGDIPTDISPSHKGKRKPSDEKDRKRTQSQARAAARSRTTSHASVAPAAVAPQVKQARPTPLNADLVVTPAAAQEPTGIPTPEVKTPSPVTKTVREIKTRENTIHFLRTNLPREEQALINLLKEEFQKLLLLQTRATAVGTKISDVLKNKIQETILLITEFDKQHATNENTLKDSKKILEQCEAILSQYLAEFPSRRREPDTTFITLANAIHALEHLRANIELTASMGNTYALVEDPMPTAFQKSETYASDMFHWAQGSAIILGKNIAEQKAKEPKKIADAIEIIYADLIDRLQDLIAAAPSINADRPTLQNVRALIQDLATNDATRLSTCETKEAEYQYINKILEELKQTLGRMQGVSPQVDLLNAGVLALATLKKHQIANPAEPESASLSEDLRQLSSSAPRSVFDKLTKTYLVESMSLTAAVNTLFKFIQARLKNNAQRILISDDAKETDLANVTQVHVLNEHISSLVQAQNARAAKKAEIKINRALIGLGLIDDTTSAAIDALINLKRHEISNPGYKEEDLARLMQPVISNQAVTEEHLNQLQKWKVEASQVAAASASAQHHEQKETKQQPTTPKSTLASLFSQTVNASSENVTQNLDKAIFTLEDFLLELIKDCKSNDGFVNQLRTSIVNCARGTSENIVNKQLNFFTNVSQTIEKREYLQQIDPQLLCLGLLALHDLKQLQLARAIPNRFPAAHTIANPTITETDPKGIFTQLSNWATSHTKQPMSQKAQTVTAEPTEQKTVGVPAVSETKSAIAPSAASVALTAAVAAQTPKLTFWTFWQNIYLSLRYGINSEQYLGFKNPPVKSQPVAAVAAVSSTTKTVITTPGMGGLKVRVVNAAQPTKIVSDKKAASESKSPDGLTIARRINRIRDNLEFWANEARNLSKKQTSTMSAEATKVGLKHEGNDPQLPSFIAELQYTYDAEQDVAQRYFDANKNGWRCVKLFKSHSTEDHLVSFAKAIVYQDTNTLIADTLLTHLEHAIAAAGFAPQQPSPSARNGKSG